jgi:hypothetical protein
MRAPRLSGVTELLHVARYVGVAFRGRLIHPAIALSLRPSKPGDRSFQCLRATDEIGEQLLAYIDMSLIFGKITRVVRLKKSLDVGGTCTERMDQR